jgi:hypothetical protein
MWLRLLSYGDLYFQSESLVFYRIHQNAAGQSVKSIAPADFMKAVASVEALFDWKITNVQRFLIKQKVRVLTMLRNVVYLLFAK